MQSKTKSSVTSIAEPVSVSSPKKSTNEGMRRICSTSLACLAGGAKRASLL